jgi:hypothetical protein
MFWQMVSKVPAREKSNASVWAAEHGASSPAAAEPEGANAGHRFRIHGRLGEELPEQLVGGDPAIEPDADEGERLREALAQATEIDLHDVYIAVGEREVRVWGTVADDGERQQLEELVARLTTGTPLRSQLRPRNP